MVSGEMADAIAEAIRGISNATSSEKPDVIQCAVLRLLNRASPALAAENDMLNTNAPIAATAARLLPSAALFEG